VTIGGLADHPDAVNYRHPDSAQISYPKVVNNVDPIGSLPPDSAALDVGIVGAGPGGIVALYELSRMATAQRRVKVTLYERDSINFAVQRSPAQSKALFQTRAGRVSSYFSSPGGTPDSANTVYEIGAMRFPSIAGLTWHYAKSVFGSDPLCNQFPNPGTVPTEFVFANQFDRYVGNTWLDPQSPTKLVRDLVLQGLVGQVDASGSPVPNSSLYPIGTRTAIEASQLLMNPTATVGALNLFIADWNKFIADNDGTTLEGAVRRILTSYQGNLPAIDGIGGGQLISYCVELFGRFGFGTGGFKPLFNISLVEMMRLLLWDYSNEYTLPTELVKGNVDFIKAIYDKALANPYFTCEVKHARVSDVFMSTDLARTTRANVAFYPSGMPTIVEFGTHDYGIIALPHDVAAQVVARAGYRADIANYVIGDKGSAATPPSGIASVVAPALQLSGMPAETGRVVSAIGSLHMTSSSKIFSTITEANATSAVVPEFPTGSGDKISAVISDSGLAATYMVPSSTQPANFRSFLVSYSWDDDSTKLQNALARWPENDDNLAVGGISMYDAMVNRTYRVNPGSGEEQSPPKWWLSTTLDQVEAPDKVSYDWTTHTTAGGFKLDMTGDYYQSNLCFRYHTHAAVDGVNNRFFLAGCSFSHLGGWLEGAFMTAINAVAGVALAANNKNLNALNQEAQKLFTSLTPIYPMR